MTSRGRRGRALAVLVAVLLVSCARGGRVDRVIGRDSVRVGVTPPDTLSHFIEEVGP